MPNQSERDTTALDELRQQARVDLAAAQRLAVENGLSEGIYNHFTLAVPGRPDCFYINPLGLHWSEVTASCLLTVDLDGNVVDGEGPVLRSAFAIHAPIHRRLPEHAAILHTHMPFASALTRLEDQRLLPIGHGEAMLVEQIAYDENYTGIASDPSEGDRLADILGTKSILIMAHHGVLVTGRNIAQAYDRLTKLESAARLQLYAMWTGKPLRYISDELLHQIDQEFRNAPPAIGGSVPGYELHFRALKRGLDRTDAGYKD